MQMFGYLVGTVGAFDYKKIYPSCSQAILSLYIRKQSDKNIWSLNRRYKCSSQEIWTNFTMSSFRSRFTLGPNTTPSHSSSVVEVISGHYMPHLSWNNDWICNYLDSMMSYLVITCPNSQKQLPKSFRIWSSWSRFELDQTNLLGS